VNGGNATKLLRRTWLRWTQLREQDRVGARRLCGISASPCNLRNRGTTRCAKLCYGNPFSVSVVRQARENVRNESRVRGVICRAPLCWTGDNASTRARIAHRPTTWFCSHPTAKWRRWSCGSNARSSRFARSSSLWLPSDHWYVRPKISQTKWTKYSYQRLSG